MDMNMQITNARFNEYESIQATVDGVELSIPVDEANRHYAEIVRQGITPAAYVAPAPTYKELRAAEYNLKTMGEQFGMQYDDAKNSTTTWVDWQTEIKERITE
jgi:hypothetical protein